MDSEHVCERCDRGFKTIQALRGHESLSHGQRAVQALDLAERLAPLLQRLEVLEDLSARAYEELQAQQRALKGSVILLERVVRLYEGRKPESPAVETVLLVGDQ